MDGPGFNLFFRPGFRGSIQPTTVFILMLAGSDFIYCVVNLPLYAVQYLNRRWTMGRTLCKVNAVFRYVNAFSDWMSLGLIALSRCLNLTHPHLMETVSTRTLVVAAVVGNIIYSLALIAPTIAGVKNY